MTNNSSNTGKKSTDETPMWTWKCLICGEEMQVIFEACDEKGLLPNFTNGGTVNIDFGYGSQFDNLMLPGTWQSAIHDECFNKIRERSRRVLTFNKKRFEQQED